MEVARSAARDRRDDAGLIDAPDPVVAVVDEEEPAFRVERDPVGAQRLRLGGRPAVALEASTEASGTATDDDLETPSGPMR